MNPTTSLVRCCFLASALAAIPGCGGSNPRDPNDNNDGNNGGGRTVLRETIGIDLAQVNSFVALSGTNASGQALLGRHSALESPQSAPEAADTSSGPKLLALTLSGEVLEVSLVEGSNPDAIGQVSQPAVTAIYPTASWVLFATPGFGMNGPDSAPLPCNLIAARRKDGALYCSPLFANNGWTGRDVNSSIFGNAAGDVVYTWAGVAGAQGMVSEDSFGLYKISLGGTAGPSAAPALDFPLFILHMFRVNGAGDLFVNYLPSSMDPAARSLILPADGGNAYTVQGTYNNYAIAGEFGQADENTFYVGSGGGFGHSFEGQIRVVSKQGSAFVETDQTLSLAGADAYGGFYRLRDGVYMFSASQKALVKVIANGALIPSPTPIPLVGVDRVLGLDSTNSIYPAGGWWVFIAASGSGYMFVRHDGTTQQDIPFDANIDVRSFNVSAEGAIDFLGVRLGTTEKLRGSVPAGSTEVTISSAGMLDPAKVVAFTRIN